MAKKTGWIAALSAHTTADNREIEESIVDELAETYDPKFYTARINLEHISWYSRFGDVLEVKNQVEDGIKKLFVKLHANELLESINQADQAVFLSVEFVRNFAGTGKAYLTGLALTDQPASIGIGRVSLSVGGNQQTVETTTCRYEFNYNNTQDKPGMVASLIKKFNNDNNQESVMQQEEIKALQDKNTEQLAAIKSADQLANQELSTLKGESDAIIKASKAQFELIQALTQTVESLQIELTTLKDTLNKTLKDFSRPPATGSTGNDEVDDNII